MAAFYVLNTDASIGPSRKAAIGVVGGAARRVLLAA
jgi:hypothetical protein